MRTAVETINQMADEHGYTGDEARTVVDALDDLSTVLSGGGGGGGGWALVVTADSDHVLNKTAGEILDAFESGPVMVSNANGSMFPITSADAGVDEGTYLFVTLNCDYIATGLDGYPEMSK